MNLVPSNSNITMTSLDLVDYINSQRDEGESELQHKHFCEKVPKVLGTERSAELLADLPDSYGRPRKGYRFPKREACLMAMSYSYDLRHEATSRLFEKTKLSDLQIAKITGHRDPRMLMRYANLRASDLADHLW